MFYSCNNDREIGTKKGTRENSTSPRETWVGKGKKWLHREGGSYRFADSMAPHEVYWHTPATEVIAIDKPNLQPSGAVARIFSCFFHFLYLFLCCYLPPSLYIRFLFNPFHVMLRMFCQSRRVTCLLVLRVLFGIDRKKKTYCVQSRENGQRHSFLMAFHSLAFLSILRINLYFYFRTSCKPLRK